MADQAGRVAVVTGGGRGLGRATSLGLAGRGATVVALARSEAQLAETVRLAAGAGGTVVPMVGDVADVDVVLALGQRVQAEVGRPTILVNAAGTFGPIALVHETDPHEWVRTILVDAVAAYLTVRAFLPGMLDEGWGRIVNITSAASLHPPGPLNSAYGTAKVALNQFTRHLAAEIAGSGVTANVIHPGDVRTDMWAYIRDTCAGMGAVAEGYRAWAQWVDETGGDPPAKAVDLILHLTSDAGGSINGRFNWIEDPLQAPIPSWDEPSDERPWIKQ
ncbi:MAG TPA: SDR family oxidoreductase [Candidatus Limnocylindrales bacterium]|nr:SDR family oxidoreductase [Candidatus Limnocylindrales bacterium]